MKLGIMQPYLFPYIGYYQLINAVDQYVIYDDVNYIKGGWVNRNHILVNNRKFLFTIALDHACPHKHINEILIKDDCMKILKTIYLSYKRAPYFQQTMKLLEEIFSLPEPNLGKFLTNSIIATSHHLKIKTEIFTSSDIEKDCTLKGKNMVLSICKHFGAGTYINAIGGQCLYDKDDFASHNITLQFLEPCLTEYKQYNHEFVPKLSMIDVMMFNTPEEIHRQLDKYKCI